MPRKHVVGLISDTHGLLRAEALALMRGSDLIVHAGDVGDPGILSALAAVAPLVAVRGNVDREDWARSLPLREVVPVGDALLCVIHDIGELDLDPVAAGFAAVISGHSHRPGMHRKDGVLYVNPGSAGRRRFSLPIAVGRLTVGNDGIAAELIEIEAPSR